MTQKNNAILNVPTSWEVVPLGEFVESEKGKKPKNENTEKTSVFCIPYVDIAAFEEGIIKSWTDGDGCRLCYEHDFLMVWDGSRSGLVGKGMNGALGSTLVRINFPKINNKYAYYFLLSKFAEINSRAKGVGIPHVDPNLLWNYSFPIPPLNEQKRIVAKIEELFSKLDKGIESLKTAREQLKVYRHCRLDEAASGKILVSDSAAKVPFSENIYVPLGSIVSDLGQGWSPKCYEHPSPSEDVWGVIKTTAIQHLEFDGCENKELPPHLDPRTHLEIKVNDILITRAGPRNRVGVACLVKNVRRRLILCDKAYRLRVDQTKILPEYLVMLLNTPKIIYKIEEIKTGINDSGVNLTQNRFLDLVLPVPAIEIQKKILLELEVNLSNVTHLEGQIEESLSRSDALRQAILKKAFSGELVAQDRKDEPASVLLERIRAEKESQSPQRKTKSKRGAA